MLTTSSELEVQTESAAETWEVGRMLGELMEPGHVIALRGELGSGKTCLAQGIASGLGVSGPVTSPTFIIVNEYDTASGARFYHIDCYRFAEDGTSEGVSIGLDEVLDSSGMCVVEWAERVEPLLPPDHLSVTLSFVDQQTRRLVFRARGPRHRKLLELLAQPSGEVPVGAGPVQANSFAEASSQWSVSNGEA